MLSAIGSSTELKGVLLSRGERGGERGRQVGRQTREGGDMDNN